MNGNLYRIIGLVLVLIISICPCVFSHHHSNECCLEENHDYSETSLLEQEQHCNHDHNAGHKALIRRCFHTHDVLTSLGEKEFHFKCNATISALSIAFDHAEGANPFPLCNEDLHFPNVIIRLLI
jgi:hypothetical protein